MRLSTAMFVLVGGVYLGITLYVPMPTDMDAKMEFYLKTIGFKFSKLIMYLEYLVRGGSTIDFSVVQNIMICITTVYRVGAALTRNSEGSKFTLDDTTFDGVRVLFYQRTDGRQENRPAFIFLHGGGLTIGSVDIYEMVTDDIAGHLDGMVVISVDYRLAPEHPFPAAYDDGLAVTKWLMRHADVYGVDATRIALGGDSAGAYLTAAIVQAIHDNPTLPNVRLQVHLFPWLQHFDYQTPSYQKNAHIFGERTWVENTIPGFCFSAYFNGVLNDSLVEQMTTNNHTSAAFKNSALYWKTFNHSLIPKDFRDPAYYTPPQSSDFGNEEIWNELKDVVLDTRFSPILREDMRGLPKAYIATCGYDPIRDDGIFYFHRLKDAGVDVFWVDYDAAFHSLDWYYPLYSETGKQLQRGFINFIKDNI
ncbi:arylacetamide deacetylase-like [Strongylocentrotus purpuratus]|uniref:Alpha/beta hydrolase fold-3 domain-containing protein n=1 Tax=Strongylocentrotus purpuratus TaxID=7668 RepID=A0A7M7HNV5_STRPU|nr:arylacetamide deacetylase-like [Strongylocentrotus purpuratus]